MTITTTMKDNKPRRILIKIVHIFKLTSPLTKGQQYCTRLKTARAVLPKLLGLTRLEDGGTRACELHNGTRTRDMSAEEK